ncbi:MAG: tetratricopeptide repeat protein [Deltaproteobacteria bacterium]
MDLTKILLIFIGCLLVLAAVIGFMMYFSEVENNRRYRAETRRLSEESQEEIRGLKEQLSAQKEKDAEAKQKVLDQLTDYAQQRDAAIKKVEEVTQQFTRKLGLSEGASEDINKLRSMVVKLRQENEEGIKGLEDFFKKRQTAYEARILSLEAQAAKAKQRYEEEAERYHYNLGVVYTQAKDFESAVKEFQKALGFNPRNAKAHYNLGIIFDDYFRDTESARYHYLNFLELDPLSDDADSVREWLNNLDKKK